MMDEFEFHLLVMAGILLSGVLLLLTSGYIHDYALSVKIDCEKHDNIYCNPLQVDRTRDYTGIFYISGLVAISAFMMVVE